ncbi:MAG: hypothetical protein ING12_05395 [Roseomonas sp.]|nr:hypothetical protein [Roseomonas sp.]
MSSTKATKATKTTKSDLALAINLLLEDWWKGYKDSKENTVIGTDKRRRRSMRKAVCSKFRIESRNLDNWLDRNTRPQKADWDELCRALNDTEVNKELIASAQDAYNASKKNHVASSADIAAPASSAAAVAMPATSPATAQATPAALPAPTPLRFLPDHSTPKAPRTDPWFKLVLIDPPLAAPNQLVFSIEYRPQPVSLPAKEGQPPLRFQVTLPKARVAPDWGVVTSVKDGIYTSPANPEVIYEMGWTVTLPQQVNGLALDHFLAASLQARAPGDKLTLTVFAERDSIGVTRLDGGRTNGNREAVIAQALKMLGFEGKDDNVILDTGAVIAT